MVPLLPTYSPSVVTGSTYIYSWYRCTAFIRYKYHQEKVKMIESITLTIAVLFLHVMPGIHVASDALTNSPCMMRCLYNKRFHLKHVPTGEYIVYRTDGLEDYVRMATKDDIWSHDPLSSANLLWILYIEVRSHLAKVHIIAVDA